MIIVLNLLSNHQTLEIYLINATAPSNPFDLDCVQKQWDNVFISENN